MYELGLSVEETDGNGMKPLHLAIKQGKESVVELLIAVEPNLDQTDGEKNTLLHMAACSNNYKIARTLIMRGVSRKRKNKLGLLPYDLLSLNSNPSLKKILVEYK